jgi:hypothetical protein
MTRPKTASVRAWGPALVLLLMVLPGRAAADPSDETLLFTQLTAARAQHRVNALARSAELDTIARRHAIRIAGAPQPFHNPGLLGETPGWLSVGEVVGRVDGGPGWEARLQQLFLASPTHRRVMLGTNFTVVGIATVRTPANVVNAVEVFGRPSGTRSARPPRAARAEPAPGARTAPAPTTAPPATTTTQARSRLALAPVPSGPAVPPAAAPVTPAAAARAGPSRPLAVGATAAEVAVVGALVVVASASRSRRAGRRPTGC